MLDMTRQQLQFVQLCVDVSFRLTEAQSKVVVQTSCPVLVSPLVLTTQAQFSSRAEPCLLHRRTTFLFTCPPRPLKETWDKVNPTLTLQVVCKKTSS